jgi:hypothetical protein
MKQNSLLNFAQIIEVYCKAIVEYDGNRMRQNVVYNCLENCKIKQRNSLRREQSKCLVTHLYLNNILFLSFVANTKENTIDNQ